MLSSFSRNISRGSKLGPHTGYRVLALGPSHPPSRDGNLPPGPAILTSPSIQVTSSPSPREHLTVTEGSAPPPKSLSPGKHFQCPLLSSRCCPLGATFWFVNVPITTWHLKLNDIPRKPRDSPAIWEPCVY